MSFVGVLYLIFINLFSIKSRKDIGVGSVGAKSKEDDLNAEVLSRDGVEHFFNLRFDSSHSLNRERHGVPCERIRKRRLELQKDNKDCRTLCQRDEGRGRETHLVSDNI